MDYYFCSFFSTQRYSYKFIAQIRTTLRFSETEISNILIPAKCAYILKVTSLFLSLAGHFLIKMFLCQTEDERLDEKENSLPPASAATSTVSAGSCSTRWSSPEPDNQSERSNSGSKSPETLVSIHSPNIGKSQYSMIWSENRAC